MALHAGVVPIALIDAMYPLVAVRALMAGVRLGVFEALADAPKAAGALAAELRCDATSLELLLRTLCLSGYAARKGNGAFRLTHKARRHLLPGAPADLRGLLQWNYTQWKLMEELDDTIRTGRGVDFHETLKDAEAWGHYQQAMLDLARLDAPLITRRIPVRKGAQELLDVAGSHGLFSAALVRAHPGLQATVLDLPSAVPHARRIAENYGHANAVEHVAGDLVRDEWGQRDVVLLHNILHHFLPAVVRDLLVKAHRSLRAGGTVSIWDLERPDAKAPVRDGDGAALFFRVTSSASTYSAVEYQTWLSAAGFSDVSVYRPLRRPGQILVTARR